MACCSMLFRGTKIKELHVCWTAGENASKPCFFWEMTVIRCETHPGHEDTWQSPWPRRHLTDRIDGCTQRKPRVGWHTWSGPRVGSRVAMIYTTLAFHVAGLKVQGATSTFRRSLLAFLFTAEGHCANPSFTNPNLLHWLWFGHFSFLGFVVRYDAS